MGDGNLIAGSAAETPVRTDIDGQQSRAKTLEIMFMRASGVYRAVAASECTLSRLAGGTSSRIQECIQSEVPPYQVILYSVRARCLPKDRGQTSD